MKAKLSDKYYTFEEARAKLGMTKPRFQYWVRSGKIKKVTPPNSKQGVYLKKEIDALVQEMLAFLTIEGDTLEFRKATADDAQDEFDLAEFVFGKALHDVPTHIAWLNKNPDIDFVVRDNTQLVGFLTMFPVEHETIMRFMRGEMRGWDLTIDDLLTYTPKSEVECIIMDMATTPDAKKGRRVQYGARLVSGLIDFLRELAAKQVTITKLYAVSDSPSGEAILRNVGFEEIQRLGKRISFELDTQTADAPLAHLYRQALIEAKVEEYRQSLLTAQQQGRGEQLPSEQPPATTPEKLDSKTERQPRTT